MLLMKIGWSHCRYGYSFTCSQRVVVIFFSFSFFFFLLLRCALYSTCHFVKSSIIVPLSSKFFAVLTHGFGKSVCKLQMMSTFLNISSKWYFHVGVVNEMRVHSQFS